MAGKASQVRATAKVVCGGRRIGEEQPHEQASAEGRAARREERRLNRPAVARRVRRDVLPLERRKAEDAARAGRAAGVSGAQLEQHAADAA